MTDAEQARSRRRRKQAIVGAAGLAAVLGGGAIVATSLMSDSTDARVTEIGAPAPVAPATSASSAAGASAPSASATTTTKPASRPATTSTSSPAPKSPAERAKAAKEAGARSGVKAMHPLPPAAGADTVSAADVAVTQIGSLRDEAGQIKVMSARTDLTGYRELRWVADDGEAIGNARCSQTFRFSPDAEPAERPTFLICWRMSATRSVYTTATDLDGRPSKAASVAALDKQWNKLG